MTAADVLTKMQVLDNELDVSSGGADETRALAALDMAQDAFEAVVASVPEILGTIDTVTASANTESTAWPTTLMRIDALWMVNTSASPNRPSYKLDEIEDVGGNSNQAPYWPITPYWSATPGAPWGYWTNRAHIYWAPLPDVAYTIRCYGFYSKTNLTTRAITYGFPDQVSMPMAAFAVRLMGIGVDDLTEEIKALALETYGPVIKMLQQPSRQQPQARYYSRVHFT